MHGFSGGGIFLTLGFLSLICSMAFWFRDVISEGKILLTHIILYINNLNTAKAIPTEDVEQALNIYKANTSARNTPSYPPRGGGTGWRLYTNNNNNFGYYLAGLLEGDGHISLPALGNTTLNRVLNPRIVFTSHTNNLGLYSLIQSELGKIGRFQITGNNTLRYIIGDKNGIILFIHLIHGKLRTPKNKRFNDLIKFINSKYSLDIPESLLDTSDFTSNSWFTGFTSLQKKIRDYR